jgi:YVTN family beta-propeller protein
MAMPVTLAVTSVNLYASGGAMSSGTLTTISTATGKVTRAIKLGTFPVALAVASNGQTAYVAGVGSDEDGSPGTYFPVDLATGAVGKAVSVGTSPEAVALSPNGHTVYVVSSYDAATEAPSGSVRAVNTATGAVGHAITVAAGPTAIAITPSGLSAFVLGMNDVTELMTSTSTARPAIKITATAVAITPNSQWAYLVGHAPSKPVEVVPVSTATGQAGTGVSTGATVPGALAISPNNQTVYVVGTPDPGLSGKDDAVSFISTATNKVTKTVNLGSHPSATGWQVVVSPNGKVAYALGFGTPKQQGVVIPINTAAGTAGNPIPVGDNAAAITFGPGGQFAYVLDGGSVTGGPRLAGGVLPIDVATGVAGKSIPVAAYAQEMTAS